jgi:secreted trypsin-like serine protease
MTSFFFSVSIFLFSISAYAIVGEDVESPAESLFPSLCKITVMNSREMREDLCTGTLVDGGNVLTAGHCFVLLKLRNPN